MRLGGRLFENPSDPDGWIGALKERGYRAAYCPVAPGSTGANPGPWAEAAREADIVIAEVGAWSNPLHPDPAERAAALDLCKNGLDLAERIGARCCVNIPGTRAAARSAPHPDNFRAETFAMIVDSVREIVDAVRPRRTFYTLELMPWIYPENADDVLDLLRAIDRPAVAVHLDPVNVITSPRRLYGQAEFLGDLVARLGPHIRSVHLKDIRLGSKLTVHLDEVAPGAGELDLGLLLRLLRPLGDDLPLMLEHLPDDAAYRDAARTVRSVARGEGIDL